MNPPTVLRPDTVDGPHRRIGLAVGAAGLALVTAVALAFVVGLGGGPSTIPRITYENPTDYAIDVEVTSGAGTAWTSAGHVGQRSTDVAHEVTDQGDVWRFRFTGQGESGGELRMTRAELEASGWTVSIPAEVGRRLAETGAPPTP